MRKASRLISLLLSLCTVMSLIVVPAHATIDGDNGGGGVGGGSGKGTFASSQQGYRMYIVDENGSLVSNKVDLLFDKTSNLNYGNTANYPWVMLFNTKFEKYTGPGSESASSEIYYISDLTGAGFSSPIYESLRWNGSAFEGQGDQLRDWLIDGVEMLVSSSGVGTGGGSGTNYRPGKPTGGSSTKPNTGEGTGSNTGGSTTDGNTSTGGTSQGGSSSSTLPNNTYTISSSIQKAMQNTFNVYRNSGIYTKAQATAAAAKLGTDRLNSLIKSGIYSQDQINYWKTSIAQKIDCFDREYPDWEVNTSNKTDTGRGRGFGSDPEKTGGFGGSFNSSSAASLIDTPTTSMNNDISFLDGIFDIAYAAETSEQKGNIYPLLEAVVNGKKLFQFKSGDTVKDKDGKVLVVDTICANNYKFCIEAIYWFAPAKVGDIYRWGKRFYGTVTNYSQLMVYNASHKLWTDGGSGGHMNPTLTKTAATALRPKKDLVAGDGSEGNTILVHKISSDLTKAQAHSTLAAKDKGYDFHWYAGDTPKPDVPETSTYDDVPEKYTYPEYTEYPDGKTTKRVVNKTPHLAVDPAPPDKGGKIKLLPTELQEPGTPITPDVDLDNLEPGYLNTTRTIHIVKCYDIIHLDGTIEHVTTNVRDGEPGKIAIRHEPDYKVVGHFSSKDYYGFTQAPITEEVEWDWLKVIEPTQLEDGSTTLSEWEYESVQDKEAGEPVDNSPVRIGVAADLEYNPDEPVDEKHPDGKPDPRYEDTTLYVHLVKKEKIPETSTWDQISVPPGGNPPVVPPNPAPDPFNPPITDPETDEPSERFSHYRIVKVYETEDEETGDISTDAVFVTFPTNPIVHIEDEAQKGTPDFSYHLIEWEYGDEYDERTLNIEFEPRWEIITSPVNPKGSGTTEDTVNLIDKDDFEKTVTLYVRLRRIIGLPRIPGQIIIEQSQISKAIHSNDKNIGGRFGDYSFAMTIGDFKVSHITYLNDGCCRGHKFCSTCHGHTCYHEMPGRDGDNKVNFNFDLISAQHDLEIPKGVYDQTDPRVFGQSGSGPKAIDPGISYPKTIPGMKASGNKYYFTSNGNDSNGAEYVTILWRCSKQGLNDVPTLALYKKKDITQRFSSDNYTIPEALLNSVGSAPKKVSNKKRASAPMAFAYDFTFGLHDRSDIRGVSSCVTYNGSTCIDHDPQDYYPIEGTKFTYDFRAQVAIQFYAGQAKGLQAAPFGSKSTQPQLEKGKVKHKENNVIQGKQEVRFYPYIHMTYMLNNLKDAELEEQNRYETGSKKPEVRKDTYVLSEWESSVLPADAVTVEWKNDHEKESLVLTSQQWSVHQKAVNGVDGNKQVWNGKNQVLPGGAIYQLSTPKENWTTVNLTTYQTVIDQKARSEYLSKDLSGDEYTESKVAKDHLDFINDAKEVLDNLKVVQWVNKNFSASTAWPKDFKEVDGDGALCLRGLGEKLRPDLGSDMKETANTDEKYYMRQQTQLSNFQNSKLSEWTKTIDESQSIKEQSYEGDLDVFNMRHTIVVYKLFTDTNGNVYLANIEKKYGVNDTGMDNAENDIKQAIQSMKDLNADTYAMGQTGGATVTKLCDKKTAGGVINSVLTGDVKEMDTVTSFITNFVSALTRNKGSDYTAEWAKALTDGKWYNEAFDGAYMVKQQATFNIGFAFSSTRTSALDPALCPQNKGQSDLYTKAFLSQFCLDSQSDATIAQGKKLNYLGTFKDADITMPDMESMYVSKKFYIPNANVQDLN